MKGADIEKCKNPTNPMEGPSDEGKHSVTKTRGRQKKKKGAKIDATSELNTSKLVFFNANIMTEFDFS